MKKLFLLTVLCGLTLLVANAQRVTDNLSRGIVAIPQGDKTGQDERYGMSGSGIFVSWRILPTEYYDTKYNLYRGSEKIASDLTVSNYQDDKGKKSDTYKVVPVIRGTERNDLAATCTPWDHQYWEIPVAKVLNRNGVDVTSGYSLNDCSVADVDGDGQMEFVVKRRNDSGNLNTSGNTTDFNRHECYKMDGTLLWSIDMGPNLMAGPDEQFDLILYDWDQDGKAEALMRGADNMIMPHVMNIPRKEKNTCSTSMVRRVSLISVGTVVTPGPRWTILCLVLKQVKVTMLLFGGPVIQATVLVSTISVLPIWTVAMPPSSWVVAATRAISSAPLM